MSDYVSIEQATADVSKKTQQFIPFHDLVPNTAVRVTDDGLIWAVDLVMAVTGKNRNDAGEVLRNLKPEIYPQERFLTKKMPGIGNTHVRLLKFQDAIELVMVLPGDMAKEFRKKAADVLKRYFAGHESIINETLANAASSAPLNAAARAGIAAQTDNDACSHIQKRARVEPPTMDAQWRLEMVELFKSVANVVKTDELHAENVRLEKELAEERKAAALKEQHWECELALRQQLWEQEKEAAEEKLLGKLQSKEEELASCKTQLREQLHSKEEELALRQQVWNQEKEASEEKLQSKEEELKLRQQLWEQEKEAAEDKLLGKLQSKEEELHSKEEELKLRQRAWGHEQEVYEARLQALEREKEQAEERAAEAERLRELDMSHIPPCALFLSALANTQPIANNDSGKGAKRKKGAAATVPEPWQNVGVDDAFLMKASYLDNQARLTSFNALGAQPGSSSAARNAGYCDSKYVERFVAEAIGHRRIKVHTEQGLGVSGEFYLMSRAYLKERLQRMGMYSARPKLPQSLLVEPLSPQVAEGLEACLPGSP